MRRTWASCRRTEAGGFTLLEVLVVVAIMALVAGVVVPNAFNGWRAAQVRDAERRMAAALSAWPQQAFQAGAPLEVDAAALVRAMPEWPADWRVELPQPLRYAANGMARGGQVWVTRPDGTRLAWRVTPVTGEPVRQP